MAKVTLPLGSQSAHGSVGKVITFQGNTAKLYSAPAQTNSITQEGQQERFRVITKMMNTSALWARMAGRTMLGERWYSQWMGLAEQNWWTRLSVWNSWLPAQRDSWNQYSPYQAMSEPPGFIFYLVAWTIYNVFNTEGWGYFYMAEPVATNWVDTINWWNRTLDNVFLQGKYDNIHTDLIYTPGNEWTIQSGGVYYGGSSHFSASNGSPKCNFWFLGTGLSIIHSKTQNNSAMSVWIRGLMPQVFSLYASPAENQAVWTITGVWYGLHYVELARDGADGGINVDAIEVIG